jgi:hypothetical protein
MTVSPTHIAVVIPCYNEPDVLQTIQSLFACEKPGVGVEIIVVVNAYQFSPEDICRVNRKSFEQLTQFAETHSSPDFILTPMLAENLSGHQTGAGIPRKIGMNEAIRHFREANHKEGIILSLDADTTVETNYLREIYRCFRQYRLQSATIEFHHPVEHLDKEDELRKATEIYEEYLRDYRAALEYTGYPYPYYTIGSAFAVSAETYLRAGGMGRQQAGEDFYFLQKVFPLGKSMFINTTCVYPAARISDRVPFGTGPAITKILKEKNFVKLTYQAKAFEELKLFFDQVDSFYQSPAQQIEIRIAGLSEYFVDFLKENNFLDKIDEINRHTASLPNFRQRFFNDFTAWRILTSRPYVPPYPFEWCERLIIHSESTQF